MTWNHIGVDLSSAWLDVFDPRGGHARLPNTPAAVRDWLRGLEPSDLPVFEATSGCDGHMLRQAAALNRPVRRVNPLHAWHFAQSLNLPKTDRVDAKMLARMGAERGLEPDARHDAARAELAELSGRRDQLKRMETQEKNRLSKTASPVVRHDIELVLRLLARRIRHLETQTARFLTAHPGLAEKASLLQSVPGIGRVTAVALLACMPELGGCGRRAIASLGGLAPKARESGKWRGRRGIGDGRRQVRRLLYMAAMSVLAHRSLGAGFAARMRNQGRPGKVIAIAIARKILTIANAVLRDQMPYRNPA